MKPDNEPTITPTPEGTPTQIYFRFGEQDAEGNIHMTIGMDGEERAPVAALSAMGIVAASSAISLRIAGQKQAAEAASALAKYLEGLCKEREASE